MGLLAAVATRNARMCENPTGAPRAHHQCAYFKANHLIQL